MQKAANKQIEHTFEYDTKDPGFIALQECATICSVANFDKSIPSEKVNAIKNDETLSNAEKDQRLKDL